MTEKAWLFPRAPTFSTIRTGTDLLTPPILSSIAGTGYRVVLIYKSEFTRDYPMLYALAVLWGGLAVWGVTTVIVRRFRVRECRERQAKCLSLR